MAGRWAFPAIVPIYTIPALMPGLIWACFCTFNTAASYEVH